MKNSWLRYKVTVQTHGLVKYNRTLGDIFLTNGTNVNQEPVVKHGWCWWYRKYASADRLIEGLEMEARAGQKGPVADLGPVPPWVYRKAGRGETHGLSDLLTLNIEIESGRASSGPPPFDAVQLEPSTDATSFPYLIVSNRR